MTPSKRLAIGWFVAGIIALGVVIVLELPLGGTMDAHRSAPDAAAVNAIQHGWRGDLLLDDARRAMIGDLVFIGIYGAGCVLAGLYFRARDQVVLRALGWTALASGVAFLACDYAETVSQFIQLMRFAGDDDLAGLASSLGPPKLASWIAGFLAVILGLIAERLSSRAA